MSWSDLLANSLTLNGHCRQGRDVLGIFGPMAPLINCAMKGKEFILYWMIKQMSMTFVVLVAVYEK